MYLSEARTGRSSFPGSKYGDYPLMKFGENRRKPRIKQEEKKKINILSFDGGGSKGIMEVFILKDVFNFLTILQREPASLKFLLNEEKSLDRTKGREKLRDLLDKCEKPIHPTEAFDFIVGTSVGSLIAFGLVGGKKKEQERTSMEVEEIIQMFKDCTKSMFDTRVHTGWISWFKAKAEEYLFPFPTIPYSQKGLEKILIERFGDIYLGGFPRPHGCVAGAVAKKIRQHPDKDGDAGDTVIFTTRGPKDMSKVVEVLKASSAAPIYFETPAMIGDVAYIDGGVGGNCPLAQALEAIPEVFDQQVEVESALSIAPPWTDIGPIPEENQWQYWLSYFPSQVTDGAAVYHHVTNIHRKISFQRLFPKSKEAKKFKLDETNVEAMISCMENEAIKDTSYFIDIIRAALKIHSRLDKSQGNEVGLQLCKHLFTTNPKLEFAHLLLEMAEHNSASSIEIARIKKELAECYFNLDQYDNAISYYKESQKANQQLQSEDKAKLENRIGACYERKGIYKKATEHYLITEQMIIKHEKISLSVVRDTYLGLGACELESENVAITYYKKCLDWIEKQKESAETQEASNAIVCSYNGIGNCYLKQEEFVKAEGYYTKAMDHLKIKYQEVEPDDKLKYRAMVLNGRAICFLMNCKHDQAINDFQESLEIKKNVDAKEVNKAISHTNLGNCHLKKREYNKAIEKYKTSLGIITRIYGGNAEIQGMEEIHNNLGICFMTNESLDTASSHFNKSLKIKKKLFGKTSCRSVARTYNNLGRLYMEMNQYKEAIEYHTKSIEMKIEIYGDVPSILSKAVSYQNMGECYQAMGDEEKARNYFDKVDVDVDELLQGDFF